MKRLLLLTLFFLLLIPLKSFSAYKFVKSAEVDLNGDNKTEKILLTDTTELGDFKLKIGEYSVTGKLEEGEPDGFIVVDIDKNDKSKEIAVHTPGPSDDDEYIIYGYSGHSIDTMGNLARWPTFFGNGIIHVKSWMGFWSKTEKYVLHKGTRSLKRVSQEFYSVGIEVIVKDSFPIYKTRKGKQLVAYLKPISNINILVCDPSSEDYSSHWYLIKSSPGLIGWAKLGSFSRKVEGLMWAD